MATVKRGDLTYNDYDWDAIPEDDPRVRGALDRTQLNRKQGYEIVYFISTMIDKHGFMPADIVKLERMIRNDVPSEIRTQEGIRDWIKGNWISS